jgi:2OG-Fe dioxygenase
MNVHGGTEGARKAWDGIEKRDYAIVRDTDLGLSPALRAHFSMHYFNAKVLETDHEAIHKDRDRARDVVRYEWNGDKPLLTEYPTVTIENRSGYAGTREHRRVKLLADPKAAEWVAAALSLVPPRRRQHVGTFGINFLRTRTTVVSGPHHDGEEFCLVYVVDKVGEGAETRLHHTDEQQTVELRHTLTPGDMLIFRDATYLHDVTPLVSSGAVPCQRDAIVCTVNYHETYPV